MDERLKKWRLILGKQAEEEKQEQIELSEAQQGMDGVLEALYEGDRRGGLGSSSPNVNRWLGDIRKYFPTSVVQVLQKDALERLKLDQMLREPELLEMIEADVELVATLVTLKKILPERSKETARKLIRKVVQELLKKLHAPMRQAIQGTLNRATRKANPKFKEIDWHRTIRANLKHYQPEEQFLIPDRLIGYGRKGQSLKEVILLIDQSGSMASSVVYASVFSAILASIPAIRTQVVAFDTAVVDLSKEIQDPVDLLFGIQLGGGTDIGKALGYASQLVSRPNDTVVVLLSDLYEGGNRQELFRRAAALKATGVTFLTLLALDDKGVPSYDQEIAQAMAALDIVCFACTPDQFPDLLSAALEKRDLRQFANAKGVVVKN